MQRASVPGFRPAAEIVMATPDLSQLVVLEGHARLTAIFVGGHERRVTVRAYLGVSPEIERWDCF
jgi:hypothetical protein